MGMLEQHLAQGHLATDFPVACSEHAEFGTVAAAAVVVVVAVVVAVAREDDVVGHPHQLAQHSEGMVATMDTKGFLLSNRIELVFRSTDRNFDLLLEQHVRLDVVAHLLQLHLSGDQRRMHHLPVVAYQIHLQRY